MGDPQASVPGSRALALLRVTLVGLATLCLLVVPLGYLVLSLGRRRVLVRGRTMTVHLWSRALCAVLGIRLTAKGDVPRGACLLTPNHQGYVDVLTVGALCPAAFLSRADVRDWPVMGLLSRIGGTLYVERERRRDTVRAAASVEERLRDGAAVTVFPEGRAGSGQALLPFRSSLLEAAVRTGVDCVPVAVTYRIRGAAAGRAHELVSWADGSSFFAHALCLASLRGIDATVEFLPPRRGDDRKALAGLLEADVRSALRGLPREG